MSFMHVRREGNLFIFPGKFSKDKHVLVNIMYDSIDKFSLNDTTIYWDQIFGTSTTFT